ncbi:hypothetical protein D3C83_329070 [compost metagenome]
MIVVMTTWLPRLACSQAGMSAQTAPKTAAARIASGSTTIAGSVASRASATSAAPSPPI